MDTALTIEEFHALLSSEKQENPLLVALRKLMCIQEPEEIAKLSVEPRSNWTGWN